MPNYAQPSKSTNPFDVSNEPTPVQASTVCDFHWYKNWYKVFFFISDILVCNVPSDTLYTICPILCKPFIFNIVDLGFRLFYKVHCHGLYLSTIELLTKCIFSSLITTVYITFWSLPRRNIFCVFFLWSSGFEKAGTLKYDMLTF